MKKVFNYGLLILFLLFFSSHAVSQTLQERREITKNYDLKKLAELTKQFSDYHKINRQRAYDVAKLRGVETSYYTADSSYAELQGITQDGTLLFYKTDNLDAAISTRTNYLNTGGNLGLSLDGQNMTAYVWDGGHARTTHQEYDGSGGTDRVSLGDVSAEGGLQLDSHATHVTGTICASGTYSLAKGMASQANVISYKWTNDVAEVALEASQGMLISNHSYSLKAINLDDYFFGGYTFGAYEWDTILYNVPFYLMVVSAGNLGTDTFNGSPLDPSNPEFDKLTDQGVSKNNLVVANAQDATIDANGDLVSVSINSGSSQGPSDDYRIKPDITGNGTTVTSSVATSDSSYATYNGTSMSAPNVTGSLLLLQQHYNDLYNTYMRASTLKGLALHTADDAGITGPDANFGWGLLNAKRAAETITDKGTSAIIEEIVLYDGETYTINVESDGINDLLASISWTDPADTWTVALNDSTPVLVNDLDITITQNSNTFYPWELTGVNTNAQNSSNDVDNFERIDVSNPSGTYTLTINHKGTLTNQSQNFSLIVTGITNVSSFCSAPQNLKVSDINTTTAEVSWNPSVSLPSSGYDIYYNTTGVIPAKSTLPTTSVAAGITNLNLSSLSVDTDYFIYVRANCGSGNTSEWSELTSFSTLCNPSTFPYVVNFNSSNTLPSCWVQSDEEFSDIRSNCGINTSNYLRLTGGFHSIDSSPVDVSSESIIEVSFDIRNGCLELAEPTENLDILYWNGSDWILLDSIDPIDLSQFWVHKSYELNTGLNSLFRIRFQRNGGRILIDDISIDNLEIKEPTAAPANDDACNAIALTIDQTSAGDAYTIKAATSQTNEPNTNLDNGVDGSVWFTFQAPSFGDVRITTDIVGAKSDDLEIAVYTATDCTDFATFTQVGFDQDDGREVNIEQMPVLDLQGLNSGQTYYIQVDRLPNSSASTFGIEVVSLTYTYDNTNGFSPVSPNGIDLIAYEGDLIGASLEISNGTATLTNPTSLSQVTVNSDGILDLQANLTSAVTFKSNASGTGQLADATGISISGDVTVERYMSANRAFRFVALPVTTSGSIRENWQQNGLNAGDNGFENNIGTHITGNGGSANGFDNTESNNPSMFTFNNATGAYEEVTNTNSNILQAGQSYALFIRGDRTIDLTNNSPTPNETTLKATGELHIGNYPSTPLQINTTGGEYSLIGNPYQAIVDFNEIAFTGDVNSNSFHMFNPTSTIDNPFGTFESIDATTEPANAMIQPGQSFFVRNLSTVTTNPTVQFSESDKKTDGNLTTVFSIANVSIANLHLYNALDENIDVIKFRFEAGANNAIDEFDSYKFSNQVLNFASVYNNELLAIDRRDIPQTNDAIALYIENYQGNQYEFRLATENWDDTIEVYLVDNYLNTSTLIEDNQPYAFTVDTNIPESIASDRFSLSFENTTLGLEEIVLEEQLSLFPNPTRFGKLYLSYNRMKGIDLNLNFYNILGQNVMNKQLSAVETIENEIDVSKLSSGVYLVEISSKNLKITKKLIIE